MGWQTQVVCSVILRDRGGRRGGPDLCCEGENCWGREQLLCTWRTAWFREDPNLPCLDHYQVWLGPCPLCLCSGRTGLWWGFEELQTPLWSEAIGVEVVLKHIAAGHLALLRWFPSGANSWKKTRQKLFFNDIQDEELEYNHYIYHYLHMKVIMLRRKVKVKVV